MSDKATPAFPNTFHDDVFRVVKPVKRTKKPTRQEIISVVAVCFGVDFAEGEKWVIAIKKTTKRKMK